ncbi:MAG TPA: hypothetical protein VMH36_11520 [Alphaproteobacteria bacterium]|nr:hypothetical protein [Alphaproteobacteria bacterium]
MVLTDTVEPSADPTERPSHEECRDALARIADSPRFKSAPRLASFLRFVVEAALSGQADRLKAYTIAVGALGRADDFDPTTDPIVRVEAGRLRMALERYYANGGSADPVRIEVPRGRYAPEFLWRGPSEGVLAVEMHTCREQLKSIRKRLEVLRAEHREQREVLSRNLDTLQVNMRALQSAADAIAGLRLPVPRRTGV